MNSDDPKLTAYALDELDPTERAEIEQLLRENPDALAEVEETLAFTKRLKIALKGEPTATLTERQHAVVLAASAEQKAAVLAELDYSTGSGGRRRLWLSLAAVFAVMMGVAWMVLSESAALLRKPLQRTTSALANASQRQNRVLVVQLPPPAPPAPEAMPEPPALISSEKPAERPPEALGTSIRGQGPGLAGLSSSGNGVIGDLSSQGAARAAKADSSLRLPTVSLAAPAPSATPAPANFSDTTATGQLGLASAPPVSKSGSGTMVLNGGNVGNISTAMPAEQPAIAAITVRDPARPMAAPHPAAPSPVFTRGQAGVAGELVPEDFSKMVASAKSSPEAPGPLDLSGSSGIHPSALAPEPHPEPTGADTEAYDAITDNAFLAVRENPLSTFSIDVDTASYANVRRFLNAQTRPPKGAVRIEELLNYFTYDYPQPEGDAPFSSTMEVATCPWAPEHRLVRIGLKGRDIAKDKRPASNLVFLIDVSGSMQPENKLPLLKRCLAMLVDQLTPEDTVSIAVYAGASGVVLEPTHNRAEIRAALDRLESGGSTNGAAGIQLAYRLAEQSFIKGGVNRVILATDGDFNVGVTSQSELTDLITRKAKKGTFLTVLGFGMGNLKDSTLEKLADKGNGNYAYIDTLQEGRKVLVEQMNGTLITIAKDVKIQVEFNPAQVGAYRLIGYENRLLAKEDFNDDKKDAGEIGAGHTVTALYEVVPAGQAAPGAVPPVDALKYQPSAQERAAAERAVEDSIRKEYSGGGVVNRRVYGEAPKSAGELLTLKLRYKQPDGDKSKLLEFPLTDRDETWEKSSRDFRFAASVAGFGMLLRDSAHKGTATWDTIRELAMEGRGEDRSGYRGEFLTLLDKAKALGR